MAGFAWVLAAFAAGIISAEGIQVSLWAVVAAVGVAGAGVYARSFRIAIVAQLLLILLLGHRLATIQNEQYRRNSFRNWVRLHEKDTARVIGTVAQTPELAGDYYSLRVRVSSVAGIPMDGVARLTVTGAGRTYPVVGESIETLARFRIPANFQVPGGFDYVRYLRKEGIHALGSIKSSELIHITAQSRSPFALLSRIRLQLVLALIGNFPAPDAAVLRALWLDDRSGLSAETERTLIDAGIFHVIAISGFHVSLLLLVLFFLMKRYISYSRALMISGLFLLFYFCLLEGRTSILRSFLTFLVYAFAFWRYEEARWSTVLPLSALLQLLFNPGELFDPGYHLTYLSTAAICFLAAPLCRMIRLPRKVYRFALDFIVVSLSIQLFLLPYQAFVFHRVPFGSLLANLFAIPLSSLLILAALILIPAYPVRFVLIPVISFVIKLFMQVAAFFSGVWLTVLPQPPWIVVAGYYGLLLGALLAKNKSARIAFAGGMVVCIAWIFLPTPHLANGLSIHVLDVGQGDAIVIEYPDGTVDLVDSGGFWNTDALDTGDAVLLPYLSATHITRIHRVFLTHAHADHMNGFFTLMKYIPVQEFYVSRFPYGEPNFRRLTSLVGARGIHSGKTFEQGEVQLQVLAPEDSDHTSHVANDDSLVLLLTYEGKRILLTGDAEIPTETRLASLPNLHINYLKVAHHGSKTSSTPAFLDAIHPEIGFISVGKNNWFGHPNPEVLHRLRDHHTLIYRTDQVGTITLTIRGGYGFVSFYNR